MSRIGTRRALLYRPPTAAAAGWWDIAGQTCVAAYQPKGAASLAASYVNLANPGTYDAAPGTAPTFNAATGWTFNGSSQYLTTSIVPVNDQTWSMIARFSGYTSGDKSIAGVYNGNSQMFLLSVSGTFVLYRNGGVLMINNAITAGVLAVAGNKGYRNGTVETGSVSAPSGNITNAMFLGAACVNGSASNHWPGAIQAIAIYSTTLSASDVAALTTRMQGL